MSSSCKYCKSGCSQGSRAQGKESVPSSLGVGNECQRAPGSKVVSTTLCVWRSLTPSLFSRTLLQCMQYMAERPRAALSRTQAPGGDTVPEPSREHRREVCAHHVTSTSREQFLSTWQILCPPPGKGTCTYEGMDGLVPSHRKLRTQMGDERIYVKWHFNTMS